MLRILHTADLHLGQTFGQLDPHDAKKLARARLSVVDTILGLADQYDVAAVLCAGDLFDTPEPAEDWWRGLAEKLARRSGWTRPVFLLPGNHDPLTRDSVYAKSHAFRRALPEWVHVVDRDAFEYELSSDASYTQLPADRQPAQTIWPSHFLPARTGTGGFALGLSTVPRSTCPTIRRISPLRAMRHSAAGWTTSPWGTRMGTVRFRKAVSRR